MLQTSISIVIEGKRRSKVLRRILSSEEKKNISKNLLKSSRRTRPATA